MSGIPNGAIPVLNAGFVRLVDTMGNDMSVVRSARVSYGKESKGEEADQKLINYLMEHSHHTPFEHLNFTFHIRCPLFIARQWMRHRIGSFNEISLRYTNYGDEDFWHPTEWRTNNKHNGQSSGEVDWGAEGSLPFDYCLHDTYRDIDKAYKYLIDSGVAREQARAILPMGSYTEFYWSVNARSLFNFLKLRMYESAQKEMQDYAHAVYALVQDMAPWTFEAFENHMM